ncbi:MAG: 4-alpha-glucanotransferase [Woeseiaceae bacterium]|nr:4-alpha-glucanotransferase [Woeseiaceae bacterium]
MTCRCISPRQRRCLGKPGTPGAGRQRPAVARSRRAAGLLCRRRPALGNPLYDWTRQASDGFRWWIERLRAATQHADIVRIDHFRGFESYWAVPADATSARHGTWEPGPGDALFDSLRAALGELPIVAEDLGVITPAVRALRERHGLPGMRVLQFDVADPDFTLSDIAINSVCYTAHP